MLDSTIVACFLLCREKRRKAANGSQVLRRIISVSVFVFLVFGFWGCCWGAVGVVVGLRFRSFAVGVVVGVGNGVGEREGDDDVEGISKAMATTDSRDNIYATAWRWESQSCDFDSGRWDRAVGNRGGGTSDEGDARAGVFRGVRGIGEDG